MIDQPIDLLAEPFARAIIANDLPAAHALLAHWLRDEITSEALRERFEKRFESQIRNVVAAMKYPKPHWPIDVEIDSHPTDLDELREDREIPDEVTAGNFRGWYCLQFLAAESTGVDAWADFWFLAVETDEGFRIGAFEIVDPD